MELPNEFISLLAERFAAGLSPDMVADAIAAKRPLSPKEAAEFLGISTDTLAKLDVPYVQVSPGRKRYLIADLEQWMRGRRTL